MEKINLISLCLLLSIVALFNSSTAQAQAKILYVTATGENDPVSPNYLFTDFQHSIQIGTQAGWPLSFLAGCTPMKYVAPLNSAKNKAMYQFLSMMKLAGKPVLFGVAENPGPPYSCVINSVENF